MIRKNKPLSGRVKALLVVIGVLLAFAGLTLAGGGIYLVTLGGSWYYLLAGLATTVVGGLVAMRSPLASPIFAVVFIATVVWALMESGLQFWPLFSRIFMFAIVALLLALIHPLLLKSAGREARSGRSFSVALVFLIGIGAAVWGMFQPHGLSPTEQIAPAVSVTPQTEQKNWLNYGNTPEGTRFAALDDITPDNVSKLKVAWTYHTGDVAISPHGFGAEDQEAPLQVGNVLYVCTPHNNVIALEADTGKQIWKHEVNSEVKGWLRCRGLGYADLTQPDLLNELGDTAKALQTSTAKCKQRIYDNTTDARLIALDAKTGEVCTDFGDAGTVDLKSGMGEVSPNFYSVTSAPIVAGQNIVVGGRVGDNVQVDMPGGVVRAFNLVTGDLDWAWDPGNPERTSAPLAGETYTRGTPNVWAPMSYDPKLNLIYMPTGNAAPDIYGGLRTKRDDEISSSIVALDASTGRERWHFQTVHHDLWDFDVPAQPTLIDIPDGKGGKQPALVQVTKAGQIFVLNRETGKPIREVKEIPVPAGDVDGERYSPTQPISSGMPQIGAKTFTEADMWGATPFDQLACRIMFRQMRYSGLFTPPGLDLALQLPGSLGGMNWGGVSVDPTRNLVFVNDMRLGLSVQMIKRPENQGPDAKGEFGMVQMRGTPYQARKGRYLSVLGIPCQEPPFGTMSAIDLTNGKLIWQSPLGTVRDTGPLGIKMGLNIPIGMPTIGGSLATQSGLVFYAGTQDYYLRAFDAATGKVVWRQRLPVGSQGTPITYRSPRDGKQYVLISAGGARQSPDRGDYIIAYTLPE